VSEEDIPDLELGEAEEGMISQESPEQRIYRERSMSMESHKSDKHVVVDPDMNGDAAAGGDDLLTTEEAKEKHRQFEEHRKKHYEMRNIKELLAYVSQEPLVTLEVLFSRRC
jgi:protein phosphatase inhibitor 2